MLDKIALRKQLRERRRHIPPIERLFFSKKASEILSQSPIFKQSEHIACYFSLPEEFDTGRIIEKIFKKNKKCYVPVLINKKLIFIRYQKDTILQKNRFNILEPSDPSQKIPISALNLILLPLVGFDLMGHRLGMGGGYYDRTLYEIKNIPNKPKFLGLSFSIQEIESLPNDPWDISLDGVLTEKSLIWFEKIIKS